jgi:hypothetical protein
MVADHQGGQHQGGMKAATCRVDDGRGCLGPIGIAPFPPPLIKPDGRDWDRNRARPAVGEGFPFLLFRLQDGFTVPPWLTLATFLAAENLRSSGQGVDMNRPSLLEATA